MPNGGQAGYSYDAASRLLSLVHQIAGVNIESFSYSHDKVGNRTSMTDLSGTHTYGYDQLYRLISAAHSQPTNPADLYTFDPVGNRLSSADILTGAMMSITVCSLSMERVSHTTITAI